MNIETKTLAAAEGEIFFKINRADSPNSIIFIHGAGGTSDNFDKQMQALNGIYTSIAIDLPGHGKSSCRGITTVQTYRDAVIQIIEDQHLENVFLACHSMGGGVVFELFKEIKNKISGMIFIASAYTMPVNKMIFELVEKNFEGFCGLAVQFALSSDADDYCKKIVSDGLLNTGAEQAKEDYLISDGFDYKTLLKEINIPVLIIVNEKDKMISGKFTNEMHESIGTSKMVIYPMVGHMPHLENHDQVSKDIINFMNSNIKNKNI